MYLSICISNRYICYIYTSICVHIQAECMRVASVVTGFAFRQWDSRHDRKGSDRRSPEEVVREGRERTSSGDKGKGVMGRRLESS